MNIIYVSSTCSREKYAEYVENKGARVSQQAQKYNLLLAEGLARCDARVNLISSRPINRRIDSRLYFKGEKEIKNGIHFNYVPFLNYPIFRNVSIFISVFIKVLFFSSKKRETALICDALNIVASMAALAASAIRGFKTVGIVTDVPCYFSYAQKVSATQKLNLHVMRKFKGYLLLTEQMSKVVNPKDRPFVVLEGHADVSMKDVENRLEEKYPKRVCFYAGSLMKIYGIENLVRGFVKAEIPNTELHIYGDGDFKAELEEFAKHNESVKYMGVAPNSDIVKAELKATLLVNPRPTNEDYTKYSFPSKNMEYMASGTPVLTTELPGMPEDHKPYVFFIKDETKEGISEALKDVFKNSSEELHAFGLAAKDFILKEKNNISQAKKVLDFITKSF